MTSHPDLHHPGALVGQLWAVQVGHGPPLVLLHGNSEDHHRFDRLVPLLAGQYTLLGLDSPGHGRSPLGHGRLRIASMADAVADTLHRLGLHGVDVVGFSDGGNIALELALRHPGVARSLVVVGANLFPSGLKPSSRVLTDAAYAVARAGAGVVPWLRLQAERLGLMSTDPNIDPAALGRVAIPVTVVVGERDVILPEHSRLIAESLPRGRLEQIPGVGHMVPVQAPDQLAAVILGHLAAL